MERELYTVPVKAPGAGEHRTKLRQRAGAVCSTSRPGIRRTVRVVSAERRLKTFVPSAVAAARAAAAARAGVARAAAARAAAVRAVAATAVARAVPVASLEPATVWAATDGRGLVGLDGCEHLFCIHTQSPPP
jgi:hypothetical protein